MAGGWARDGAVQEQIDASVDDAVERARGRLPSGRGLSRCKDCDMEIPQARREAIAGVLRCVGCQSAMDDTETIQGGFNRRGSKDSQLR